MTGSHVRDIVNVEQVGCDWSVGKIVKAWNTRVQSPLKNNIGIQSFVKKIYQKVFTWPSGII